MDATKIFGFCLLLALLFSCNTKTHDPDLKLSEQAFIPKPNAVEDSEGGFLFDNEICVMVSERDQLSQKVAKQISIELSDYFKRDIPLSYGNKAFRTKKIFLEIDKTPDAQQHGYKLIIKPESIVISAKERPGLYYGYKTLMQMLPVIALDQFVVPCGRVTDNPSYLYRGAMLDVSRHFFNPQEVKQFIDYVSLYKFNMLHLHLADDQGWRIEIKSWPKLTEIGGSKEVGGGEGGFFTQVEYRDIVQYAAERYVTIVPEIDMPGHTNAALASYAELNCDSKRRKLYTGTKVGFSSLCTTKEVTYKFVEDVVKELAAMTPGQYIHIGGDESDATKPSDYKVFIERVEDILYKYNKRAMGWDDIANAKLSQLAVAQHWAKTENAKKAVDQKMNLVMSPAKKAYLDMKYDSTTQLGLNWAGYIEVDSAYLWEPSQYIPGIDKSNIWGVECPLWTETVTNMDELEYMVFPRLLGFAEIGWTDYAQRDWEAYKVRLASHAPRFEARGIDYYKSPKVPW